MIVVPFVFPPHLTTKGCSFPSLQADITNSALNYAEYSKPHIGESATSADKAGKYVDRPGEVTGEIRLVKGWFAIGQEVQYHPI